MQVQKHRFSIRGNSFIKLGLWVVYFSYHIVKMNIIYVLNILQIYECCVQSLNISGYFSSARDIIKPLS